MYALLRDHDPAHHVERGDYWVLSRFDDVFAAAAFTPRRVAAVQEKVRAFVAARLDRLRDSSGGDLAAEVFKPLPSMVVAHYLGVPDDYRDRFGAHHCLGAAVARLQARVALEELLGRCPEFTVDPAAGEFAPGHFVRRYLHLPLTPDGTRITGS